MSEYFIGEIELTSNLPKNGDFLDFSPLALRETIETVAEKHRDFLELMPYQKQGEPVQLVVSVYLKKTASAGRIISTSQHPMSGSTRNRGPSSTRESNVDRIYL